MVSDNSWLSDDAEDTVPGSPDEAAEAANHLLKLGSACEHAGSGIKQIETGRWTGEAADGFRANYLETAGPQWTNAGDAFTRAGKALQDYHHVLAEAKRRAAAAQVELDRANEQSQKAAEQRQGRLAQARVTATPITPPPDVPDPGAAVREQAQRIIEEAKAAVAKEGERAAQAVRSATAQAPAQPGVFQQLVNQHLDSVSFGANFYLNFGTGALKTVGETLLFGGQAAFYYSGGRFLDWEGGKQFDQQIGAALGAAWNDPSAALKTIIGVDKWKNDPASAMGELAPDIAGAAVGVGTVSKSLRGAKQVAEVGEDVNQAGRHIPDGTGGPQPSFPNHAPEPKSPLPERAPEPGPISRERHPEPEPNKTPPGPTTTPPRHPEPPPRWDPYNQEGPRDSWLEDPTKPRPPTSESTPGRPPESPELGHHKPDTPDPTPKRLSPEDIERKQSELRHGKEHEAHLERDHPEQLAEHRATMADISRQLREAGAKTPAEIDSEHPRK